MANIASVFVLLGLAAQGAGLYLATGGVALTLLVVGTEIGALGLVGVVNHARQNTRHQ